MPSAKEDARWPEAILLTLALWMFIVLIFLPVIMDRHQDSDSLWYSVFLDSGTAIVSIGLALILFAVFRNTIGMAARLRMVILVASVLSVALLNRMFDVMWIGWVTDNLESSWVNMPDTIERSYASILNYVLVFSVNMAFFQLSFVRRRDARQQRQLVDARTTAQQAQLAALRYQLNPHFLFNTLNSISALIVTKRNEDAERMTDKLSSFLRASLACDPAELVPLEEELALIEEYLEIEAVRFGERLNVQIDCEPEAGEALVPGFLVQPLVENAIKHGVAPSREPVGVHVRASVDEGVLCITVSNDRVPGVRQTIGGRAGVGLSNVRKRLDAVYGKAATLTAEPTENGFTATICIPEVQPRALT